MNAPLSMNQSASQHSGSEQGKVQLSEVARLILSIESGIPANNAPMIAQAREGLAKRLGCSSQDIQEVCDSYGPGVWDQIVGQERVKRGLSAPVERDVSWDRLETVVLKKLLMLVESNQVNGVGELIAVAKLSNQATRSNDRKIPTGGGLPGTHNHFTSVHQQINQIGYIPGDPANGVLPAGNLGTMRLSLSHRTHKQIEGTAERNGRALDSMEMLDLKAVQQAESEFSES